MTPGAHREDVISFTRWGDDIGKSKEYVRRLYYMWERFGNLVAERRPDFSDAYNEISPGSAYHPRETREEKINTAREMLSDPETIPEILSDPRVHDVIRQEMARLKEEDSQPDIFDFNYITTRIQYHLDEIDKNLDKVDRLSQHERTVIADTLTSISNRSSGLSDIMRSLGKNLDDEIGNFFNER